jgi:hypothetical protein
MTGPYVNNGRYVYVDPTIPGDGGVNMDPAIAIPSDHRLEINSAPVIEQSHEFVIRKSRPDAED